MIREQESRSLARPPLHRLSGLVETVDSLRLAASGRSVKPDRANLGQYLTPGPIARLMASLLSTDVRDVRLLEPGAGTGSLVAAAVEALCTRTRPPESIHVEAIEIDTSLIGYLHDALGFCEAFARAVGVRFTSNVISGDFLGNAADEFGQDLFSDRMVPPFDAVIMNPPYKKIRADSSYREWMRRIGLETTNLYTAFVAAAMLSLRNGGELVAITPRSFCNGTYFRSFRRFLLDRGSFTHVHLFDSRKELFRDDAVLQENIVFRLVRNGRRADVRVEASDGRQQPHTNRTISHAELVEPQDPESFIRVGTVDTDRRVVESGASIRGSLGTLGISVSTGRVVDFRARQSLRSQPEADTAPLLYPVHLRNAVVRWPVQSKKPNAIVVNESTLDLLVPKAHYVLVKRFTAKEERRRVVATVLRPEDLPGDLVGIENHLNYYHRNGRGLEPELARGLAAFLNSTFVDVFFRQFSGHTQVNATDLRSLPYPSEEQLLRLARALGEQCISPSVVDPLVDEVVIGMADAKDSPTRAKQRIAEAVDILRSLGLPRQQQNERSALTLLALLDLRPSNPWTEAHAPRRKIHDMISFLADAYAITYAENTRETIRRHSLHQFVQAGVAVINPDDAERPPNSPKTVYQIAPEVLALVRAYRTPVWEQMLGDYLAQAETLAERYHKRRHLSRVPVSISDGHAVTLTAGPHSVLVKAILEEFAPRFIPGGTVLYVGDTGKKFAYFDEKLARELWIDIEPHGKIPDVIIYDSNRNWLILIEAVTSHGPIDSKRHIELEELFKAARAGLVTPRRFQAARR